MPGGASLSTKALLHLGSRAAVDQALFRLARSGELLRAGRGIYFPAGQGQVWRMGTGNRQVVQEWASQRGETVVDHGAAAADRLSLTTQMALRVVQIPLACGHLHRGTGRRVTHAAPGDGLRSITLMTEP